MTTEATKGHADWCLNMAAIEGDAEIGAGVLAATETQSGEIEKLLEALAPFAAAADKADKKAEAIAAWNTRKETQQ